MKKFKYELIPDNEYYPEHVIEYLGSNKIELPKVYHDTYTEIITSDWYENSEREIKINKETELRVELHVRRQTINLQLELAGKPDKLVMTQPKQTPIRITIDDVLYEIDGTELEVELPYKTIPYKVSITKQFYEPLEFEFSLPSKESIVKEELKRKASEWVEKSRTESIVFEKATEVDDQLLPSKSFVKIKGVNGSKRWDWFEERIDGLMTEAKTKEVPTVVKEPVTELYIQGTLKVEWKKEVIKTEPVSFDKKTVEDQGVLPEDSGVTTKGRDGVRTYYREFEYANGKKTGDWRNETSEITSKAVDEIYTKGTMVVEWKRNLYESRTVPFKRKIEESQYLRPESSYTKIQGKNGTLFVYREYKFVNGVKTDEWRNETETLITPPTDEVWVKGTMVLEWRYMSRDALIAITTRYATDSSMFEGETRTVHGSAGIRTYLWEEEYRNGVSTGRKRNETNYVKKAMVQTVVYEGTKPKEVRHTYTMEFSVGGMGAYAGLTVTDSDSVHRIKTDFPNPFKIKYIIVNGTQYETDVEYSTYRVMFSGRRIPSIRGRQTFTLVADP